MVGGFDRVGLAEAVAARGAVVRVVVAGFRGSTPRETGAAMLVWADAMQAGGQSGTIGGGALEYEAASAARILLAGGGIWARQVLRLPLGPALGQCCGGHVTLLLERYGAAEVAALGGLSGDCFVRPTGPGLPPAAADALATARHQRAARSGEAAPGLHGGLMSEPFAAPCVPLWLYGAGHVGRAIVRVAEGLPLAITWLDTARDRFPETMPSQVAPLAAASLARAVSLAPDDAVHLVLTHSHALDLEICHAVLGRPFRHLGLIGSASKRARFHARLRDLGHSEAALARLACPIGDRGLGKLPAAIAIGVVAEMLRLPDFQQQMKVSLA
ncbi:MAG: xanthine dehydrogenase accessory protein XdhC [Amaricoccus sp.]